MGNKVSRSRGSVSNSNGSTTDITPSLSNTDSLSSLRLQIENPDSNHLHPLNIKTYTKQKKQSKPIDIQIIENLNDFWLICDGENNFKFIHGHNKLPSISMRWNPLPYTLSKNHSNVSMPWSYYRDLTFSRIQNPVICSKPTSNHFIMAQMYKHSNNDEHDPLIPHSLQQSLIHHIHKLSKDPSVQYDLYDIQTQTYLYRKTNQFGKKSTISEYLALDLNDAFDIDYGATTPPIYYSKHLSLDTNDDSYYSSDSELLITPKLIPTLSNFNTNSKKSQSLATPRSTQFRYEHEVSPMAIPSPMNKHKNPSKLLSNGLPEDYDEFMTVTLEYNHTMHTMTYTVDEEKYTDYGREINTAFIHCLIDCNKNLNDHHLWIPSVFDCTTNDISKVIRSSILGLDYVKYKGLYQDIAGVFNKMQSMFENILNRKMGATEKVIVRLNQYVLQKKNDRFEEELYKVGMGENIECVGLYFVDGNIDNDGMQIGLIHNKYKLDHITHDLQVGTGDCIVFSNHGYHKLGHIVNHEDEIKYRTVLMFYVLNDNETIMTANCKNLKVNLGFNWLYCIENWLRLNTMVDLNEYSFKWMNDLIFIYLFGHNLDEYSYNRRAKILNEKRKVQITPNEVKLRFETKHFTQKLMASFEFDADDASDLFEPPISLFNNTDIVNDINDPIFQISH